MKRIKYAIIVVVDGKETIAQVETLYTEAALAEAKKVAYKGEYVIENVERKPANK